MPSNVKQFRRESQGQGVPPPPPAQEQTVMVVFTKDSEASKDFPQGIQTFFGVLNVGVEPSGTFLVLSEKKAATFLKLTDIERVAIELQKVVA